MTKINSLGMSLSLWLFCTLTPTVWAMTISITYDASVTNIGALSQVQTGVGAAVQTLQTLYTNPITVNITVYSANAGPFGFISLGESQTEFTGSLGFKYPQLTNALFAARTTSADTNSVASLPASDPLGGAETWWIPRAEAKALGVLSVGANNPAVDGEVGFAPSNTVSYTFDPNNRAVAGKQDFIGVVLHELTEVLGRNTFNLDGSNYTPYDLFRYTNNGARNFNPSATNVYFSADNGVTRLKFFNPNLSGDIQDWASSSPADSFDAFVTSGRETSLSAADLLSLDVLGYKLNYASPRLKGTRLANGSFQLTYTNIPGTTYAMLASTNLSLAISNWAILGTNAETTAGQFQVTDAQAATNKLRFYKVRLN